MSGLAVGAGLVSSVAVVCYGVPGNIISLLFILKVYCGSCSWCINIKLPCYCIIFIIVHHHYLHHNSSSLQIIIYMAPKRRSVQDMEMEELRRQLKALQEQLVRYEAADKSYRSCKLLFIIFIYF